MFICASNSDEIFNLTSIKFEESQINYSEIIVKLTFYNNGATVVQEYTILEDGSNVRGGFYV